MKISVTVKTSARQEKVEEISAGKFRVCVKVPPREGRANEAAIKALAGHFKVPKSQVSIVVGQSRKYKVVMVGQD